MLQSCNSLIHLLKTDYKLLDHLAALRVRSDNDLIPVKVMLIYEDCLFTVTRCKGPSSLYLRHKSQAKLQVVNMGS